jgi:hypothetical protein
MATRRRRGEDGISFEHRGPCRDPQRHRHCPGLWRGEFTLGYIDDGTRTRRKASGKTKAAVVDKLRQLHHELDQGIVPKTGYANYTVRQAAQDWLANGLDGRSAKTVTKNQNVLEPILKVIGTRKLRQLTAADVRQALATMATRYSSAAVTIGHLALKRAIRHAEANDLVGRNDTPKGQQGRPSKSLTLEQALAVITAAKTLPVMELRPGLKDVRRPAELMYAYIVLSLLVGVRTEEARALRWDHVNLDGDPDADPPVPRTWRSGGRSATAARPKPSDPAARSASPSWPPRRCVRCGKARLTSGPWPGNGGRTPGWCSPPTTVRPWTRGTSGKCSNGSAPRPEPERTGRHASYAPRSSA